MNRKFLMFVAVLALSHPAFSQYRNGSVYGNLFDSETVTSFKKHVDYIASDDLEGRKAGSLGEKAVAEYVYNCLKANGVDMLCPEDGDVFGIAGAPGDTIVSRNVYGFVQGYDKSLADKYIVIGARMDNLGTNVMTVDGKETIQIYSGANGNASGLAMMLELARMVSTNSSVFRRSVIFVAFGASMHTYAGAWYFLNRSFSDVSKIDAMVNLDMVGTGSDGFYAYTSSNNDLNALLSELTGQLQPIVPELRSDEPYPSDHRAFYSKEIPSIFFTTGKYPEHNTPKDVPSILDYDTMERELEYVYNFVSALANKNMTMSFHDTVELPRAQSDDDPVPYYDCDYRPMFLNSSDPRQFLQKWVYQYLRYPQQAVEEGIQGTVQINFIIEKDGSITNVKVARGIHYLLDNEAMRVISASPKWKPGRNRGQKVRTSMTIPVEFRLESKSTRPKFGIR